MLQLLTMLQALVASLALVFGGGVGAVLLNSGVLPPGQNGVQAPAAVSASAQMATPVADPVATPFATPIASSEVLTESDLLDGPVQRLDDDEPVASSDEPLDGALLDGSTVIQAEADTSGPTAGAEAQVGELLDAPLPGGPDAADSEPLDEVERRLMDEPLDAPVLAGESLDDGRVEVPGPAEPTDDGRAQVDEPEDSSLTQVDEPLDAPRTEPEVVQAPPTPGPTQVPIVAVTDPLDAPTADDGMVQVPPGGDALDAPVTQAPVAVVPAPATSAPVADSAPPAATVSTAPTTAPVAEAPVTKQPDPVAAENAKPVTSVRSKGAAQAPVIVVAGRRPLPASLAECDVAVGAGRSTVGVGCDDTSVTAAHQPAIPRSPGSAALVSNAGPATITSRRDGVQIGEYADPDLGDSIATTVRAAIFPEDVIVPDVLIVPGELTVAGNTSREDPIVVWRSELEQAALETGIPVEMLATVIRVTSNGDPGAESPSGVGLMHVPVAELVARGVSEDKWVDPATNIRIGAQLLAAGAASPSDVLSGAAVNQYLADSCGDRPDCAGTTASQVNEWIIYYRLRATTDPLGAVSSDAAATGDDNWPFSDAVVAPSTNPIADRKREREQAEREAERALPGILAAKPEDEPEWDWPWTPPSSE